MEAVELVGRCFEHRERGDGEEHEQQRGSSRRARRVQNPAKLMPPRRAHSPMSSDVIRKPERTKNASTPRNPPRIHPASR